MEKRISQANSANKTINLALQGGGAHGAFAWGALDYLLEDGRIEFEGISATSAGAMNAVVLAQGLMNGDKDEARQALADFWKTVSDAGKISPYKALPSFPWFGKHKSYSLDSSPLFQLMDMMTRIFSPYQLNPFDFNPLKDILEKTIDFETVRQRSPIKLNICATNVETCKVRIFDNKEITAAAILASACLPFMFKSVEIDGEYSGTEAT